MIKIGAIMKKKKKISLLPLYGWRLIIFQIILGIIFVGAIGMAALSYSATKASDLIDGVFAKIERPDTIEEGELREIEATLKWLPPSCLEPETRAKWAEVTFVLQGMELYYQSTHQEGKLTFKEGKFYVNGIETFIACGPII